ncbi:hypothetical protein BOTBODRAFT_620898 [Botryobasidium botryosum FD-172 SS1]|uniref:Uncharacterized protein n=1 Tax=Botryobasidium botryosum (strain FD-172 SS1) TaxID=930990 RepID=A0A067LUP7_BOTB1|nr:hypothetical protein BOTBODRAFT_620898 [Botryobasidium botryosum FD-172 SS1]
MVTLIETSVCTPGGRLKVEVETSKGKPAYGGCKLDTVNRADPYRRTYANASEPDSGAHGRNTENQAKLAESAVGRHLASSALQRNVPERERRSLREARQAPASGLMASVIGDGGREASVAPDAAPRRAAERYGLMATARRRPSCPKTAQNARPRRPPTRKMVDMILGARIANHILYSECFNPSRFAYTLRSRTSPACCPRRLIIAAALPLLSSLWFYAKAALLVLTLQPSSSIYRRAVILPGRAHSFIFLSQPSILLCEPPPTNVRVYDTSLPYLLMDLNAADLAIVVSRDDLWNAREDGASDEFAWFIRRLLSPFPSPLFNPMIRIPSTLPITLCPINEKNCRLKTQAYRKILGTRFPVYRTACPTPYPPPTSSIRVNETYTPVSLREHGGR